jgi:hypothetical protein
MCCVMRNVYKILATKPGGNRSLDSIGTDRIPEMLVVAQNGIQFPALVNFVMNPLGASNLCRVEMFRKEDQ